MCSGQGSAIMIDSLIQSGLGPRRMLRRHMAPSAKVSAASAPAPPAKADSDTVHCGCHQVTGSTRLHVV